MEESVRFKPTGGGSFNPLSMYPIGSIYRSVKSTDPSELFGGTWQQIKDVFMMAAGDKYAAGSTGGEAEHELTQAEIPNYYIGDIAAPVPEKHANWGNNGVYASNMGAISSNKQGITGNNTFSGIQWSWRVESNGGGQAHNNLPPYLAVYTWVRVA